MRTFEIGGKERVMPFSRGRQWDLRAEVFLDCRLYSNIRTAQPAWSTFVRIIDHEAGSILGS